MLQNLNIGKRLAFGFGALALLILVMGAFAAQRMGTAQSTVRTLTQESVPSIRNLGQLATMLAEYRVSADPDVAFAFAGNLPYSKNLQQTAFDYLLARNDIVRDCARPHQDVSPFRNHDLTFLYVKGGRSGMHGPPATGTPAPCPKPSNLGISPALRR